MYIRKTINIDEIIVNILNPRYEPQSDEQEEIRLILSGNNQKKILNLMRDIAKYGTDPSDSVIVDYDEELKGYVSKEGNRRTTALKLYKEPELTPLNIEKRD